MQTVTLYIETPGGQQTYTLGKEVSIGRTSAAQLVLDDPTLSRLHATIFREGEAVWVMDENSSNGTFVNGERVAPDRKLRDRDEIKLGSHTRIFIEISQPSSYPQPSSGSFESKPAAQAPAAPVNAPPLPPIETPETQQPKGIPIIPLIGGASAFFIIVFGVAAFLIIRAYQPQSSNNGKLTPPAARINTAAVIPIRVIDPLGGQDPEDLDDFLTSWGNEEEPLKAEDIEEIKVSSSSPDGTKPNVELDVSPAFWQQQMSKALSLGKGSPTISTPEIYGKGGFARQLMKGSQLRDGGYKVPLDFADLAEHRLKGELVELPIATQTFVLDVGGSATDGPFTEFSFDKGDLPLDQNSEKYKILQRLADNFDGRKYDLNNPKDRKNMRMRLLRMYNPKSRPLFEKICAAYYDKFKVPLRVTSVMRSMDYQRSLNSVNGNSYHVRPGTVPPHTTGCTFDIGRNNLSGPEQDFLITVLSDLEKQGKLDTLIEGNVNACLHTFIFPDGVGPK